jgi:Transglutaminase-like superfamily
VRRAATTLLAAGWANRALHSVRSQLAVGKLSQVKVPPPPKLPASARRGVEAVLRLRAHTCLEGAMVRQRWLANHDVQRDVVIGVTAGKEEFLAHAWVDGEADAATGCFRELTRLSP